MIRQLDNIKFALLLPEFVYGKEGRSGGKEGAGLSQHMAGQPIPPLTLYIYQCNLMSGTQPHEAHPLGLATIKVIEKYFPSHFVRQRKGKRVYFFPSELPCTRRGSWRSKCFWEWDISTSFKLIT